MGKLIKKLLTGKFTKIDLLRLKILLGSQGIAHRYANHFWTHAHDFTYVNRVDFYKDHRHN